MPRELPPGDFEIITLLRFRPASNYQFAGLLVFQDKANVLQFGHGFSDLSEARVRKGIYFDDFEGGFILNNHKSAIKSSEVHFRLRRVGNTYPGNFSEDGENWITLGEHARILADLRVELVAAQAAEAIPAAFATVVALPRKNILS